MPSIRVISTRALRPESILFAEQQGWKLEIYPMIENPFTYRKEQILEIIHGLKGVSLQVCLVFSSSKAVKALYAGCKENFLIFPPGAKACFVGEKTARIASELLLTENVLIAENAMGLIGKLDDLNTDSFIFVSGQKRMDTIPHAILSKGFHLKEYQLYDTIYAPVKVEGDYSAALFFSPSAVESFFKANSWPNNGVAVCVGDTTAASLHQHQVEKILVADKPGEIETLRALASFIERTK